MSYNPQYGQPQMPPPPWPADALLSQPVQIQRGNPPVLPQINFMPPQLAQFYPLVVSDCMDAISAKATTNPLRVFLFNQMSHNNWQNAEFAGFVDGAMKYLDMQLTMRQYPDVPTGSAQAANVYAELFAAANAAQYPMLQNFLSPEMRQGVQNVLASLQQINQQMTQFFASQQRQPMPPPQAAWQQGQPQAQPAWQQPQHGQPAWSHAAPSAPPPWRSQPHVAAAAVNQGVTNTPLFQTGAPAAPASSDRYAAYTPPSKAGSTLPTSNAQNLHDSRRVKEEQMLNNLPTQPVKPVAAAANIVIGAGGRKIDLSKCVKASDEKAKWTPSEVFFVNIAFNPNTSDLYYEVKPDGSTEPVVIKKQESEMEMNKHLITLSYVTSAPLGTEKLDTKMRTFELDKALGNDAVALEHVKPLALNVAYKDASFHSSVCEKELWFSNDIEMAIMRKREGKANLFRSCAIAMDPIISAKNPKPFIDLLVNAESFSQACAILKTAHNHLNSAEHEHLEPKTLTFLNKRLTHHVNEFLKKQLAVPNGWIDSFMEDAMDLIEYVERKYGESMRKALSVNQKKILQTALMYGDEEFEKDQNEVYLPDEDKTLIKTNGFDKLNFTYFFSYYTLTSLDLFSAELSVELPTKDVSVAVFEKQTPLLRQIADNIFTHQKALDIEFARHLLQTADGVVYELSRSPLNHDFVLVGLA